jgi:hypothetical protein
MGDNILAKQGLGEGGSLGLGPVGTQLVVCLPARGR